MALVTKTYRVVYALDDDGYWVVDIPKLRGAHTQARTIPTARDRAREVIALITDASPDTVEIGEEEFQLPPRVAAKVAAAQEARQRADEAEAELVERLHDAAVAVVQLKSTRDAGELLGLSHGRIHQLVSERTPSTRDKRTPSATRKRTAAGKSA